MLLYLFILFTMVPLFELMLLIRIGQLFGILPTIGLVLFTGIVGAWLARREGWRTWASINHELAAGRLPGNQMIEALMILVAGVLLITPGVMTDGVGFALLIPPVRMLLRDHLKRRFRTRVQFHHFSGINGQWSSRPPGQSADDDIIDVEATVQDEDPERDSLPGQ
jgi:UPF0716 protein FxsA